MIFFKKIFYLIFFLAFFTGFFWAFPTYALNKQTKNDLEKILIGKNIPENSNNIVESDDASYDFMVNHPNYKIYFRQDPITNKANIKYQRGDSWIEFDTLSKVKITGKEKTINHIASANDWKYCKYMLGLCDVFGYFKIWGFAAVSFGQSNVAGGVTDNVTKFKYPKVWQSENAFIDADYTVSSEIFLEEFVLNEYKDIESLSQNITLHNVYLEQKDDIINFYDQEKGQILFYIPKPKMYEQADSKKENFGLHFKLSKTDDSHYILTKIIDESGKKWLKDGSRAWPVVIDSSIAYGSEYEFLEGGMLSYVNAFSIDDIDSTHFLVSYLDNDGGGVSIGTASQNSISLGLKYNFSLLDPREFDTTVLDSTHFVVAYDKPYGLGYARIGTISEGSISYGSEYQFSDSTNSSFSMTTLDSTHFVVTYLNFNDYYAYARVGTVSGDSITFGTTVQFSYYAGVPITVSALDSTHFVVAYTKNINNYQRDGYARVGTVSGDSITFGTGSIFLSSTDNAVEKVSITPLSSSSFVLGFVYSHRYYTGLYEYDGIAVIGSVSDGSITFGDTIGVDNSVSNLKNVDVSKLDSTHFIVIYSYEDNSDYDGATKIGTVSGTSITFGTRYDYESSSDYYVYRSYILALDSQHFILASYYYNSKSVILAGTIGDPPVVSSGPSDGGSSATTPTVIGSNITFTATADNADSNYYFAVCKTNSITANSNAAPTCNGGNWCISSSTVSGSQASCNYATSSGDAWSNNWYAFVCDDSYASFCSSSSQGSGDNGSPFNVNHPPIFGGVDLTQNPVNKGESIGFTAYTTSDPDSASTVTLYVCKSNDFTGSACGAAGEWCHSSAVSSTPWCEYLTQEADVGTNNYYAYVIDNFGLAAANNPVSSTFDVVDYTNTSPTFTVSPSDGGSSATAPTVIGNDISFTTSATDAESDQYYFAVCKTNSITANSNAAPTCNGGNWCISSKTDSGIGASCSYTTANEGTYDWYAFVCDYNEDSLCSDSSQGTGDNGSPFVVTLGWTSENDPALRIKNGALKIKDGLLRIMVK